jgi:hypothetical protein
VPCRLWTHRQLDGLQELIGEEEGRIRGRKEKVGRQRREATNKDIDGRDEKRGEVNKGGGGRVRDGM